MLKFKPKLFKLPIRLRHRAKFYSHRHRVIVRRGTPAIVALVFVGILLMRIIGPNNNQVARAATATATGLYPTDDLGGASNAWTTVGGSPTNLAGSPAGSCTNDSYHCNYIDKNDTSSNTYVATGTNTADTAVEEYEMQNFIVNGTFKTISSVTVYIDAVRNGVCVGGGTPCDNLTVNIYTGGGYNATSQQISGVAGTGSTNMQLTTTVHTNTMSWSGLTSANQNDLRVQVTRNTNGTGSPGTKDDDIRISSISADVTYTYTGAPANLTQEGYIFENDDQVGATNATAQAGSQFSSGPTTLGKIAKGERTNLRMHIKNTNTGQITNDNKVSLFYDRNDGIWSKVDSYTPPGTSPGSSTDCQGFDGSGGSSNYYCSAVYDGSSPNGGYVSEIETNPLTGQPTMMFSYGNSTTPEVNLAIAQYVGSNGNCDTFVSGGSDAWQCQTIFDGTSGSDVQVLDFAISSTGDIWAAFNNRATGNDLVVAHYAEALGQNCDTFDGTGGSDYWACTTVFDGSSNSDITHVALAIGADGTPWVTFNNDTSGTSDVMVAKYVSSGGNCNTFDGGTGSTAWTCTTVFDGGEANDGTGLDIAIDGSNNPAISFKNEEAGGSDLVVANYVASGGNCNTFDNSTLGSTAWSCETVFDGGEVADINTSNIMFNPAGQMAVAFSNNEATGGEVFYATKIGTSGQNCDSFDAATSGSDFWNCTRVFDGADTADGQYVSMAMDPSGRPWIVFNDDEAADRVIAAHYVGSGGNCSDTGTFDGGDSAWQCESIFEDSVANTAPYPSISFKSDGNPMISFTDQAASNPNIVVADMRRGGEISAVPSRELADGTSLTTSHADMTSASSSANTTANCISASNWNNGQYNAYGEGVGVSLPPGNSTSQCTEYMWTLDTSQAIAGTTYRFVFAVNDNFRNDKGKWRGPGTISVFPTMTIGSGTNQNVRYSKGINPRFGSTCANFVDTGGSANWDCQNVLDGDGTDDFFQHAQIVIDQNGVPNFATMYVNAGGQNNVLFGQYVGSGGNCNAVTGIDTGGSTQWNCTSVVLGSFSADFQYYTDLAIGPNNEKYITFREEDYRMIVAKYVGSGGNCDTATGDNGGSTAWQCTVVAKGTNTNGRDFQQHGEIEVSPTGIPYIVTNDAFSSSATDMLVMYYVGSGGNCDTFDGAVGSDAWECDTVISGDSTDDFNNQGSISFTKDGRPLLVGINGGASTGAAGNNLIMAEYVGSGGNCPTAVGSGRSNTDAWQCTVVLDGNSGVNGDYYNQSSVGVDQNGTPYIVTYNDMNAVGTTGGDLIIAKYVGGTSGTCKTFDDPNAGTVASGAWDCTTIIGGNSDNDFERYSSLSFDADGNPWVMATAYNETGGTTGNNLIVAHYVGSGGNCGSFVDTGGSNAWQCEKVLDGNDTSDFYQTGKLVFDKNDVPWLSTVSYNTALNTAGNNLIVAKLATPSQSFSTDKKQLYNNGNASGQKDFQYLISAGRSPYSDYNGSCEGNSTYAGFCALRVDDGSYDSITSLNGFGMPYYGMEARFASNNVAPQLIWTGTSNLSPTSGTITMQIYNYSTSAWETVASTSSACSGNCKLTGMVVTSTPSNYYTSTSSGYVMNARVFQNQDGSTTITFKSDSFLAEQQDGALHQGGFFQNGERVPLNRRR